MSQTKDDISPVMRDLSHYIADALNKPLPPEVMEKAKQHSLDTLAAMVSGAKMHPGEMAIKYARLQGGVEEAVVAGSDVVTSATIAALANGMTAHADETDDSHLASRSHLGCSVVPAALALGEKEGRTGVEMMQAVTLGYDIGGRMTPALNVNRFYAAGHSTHTFAPLFGAAAAAGALAKLNPDQVRWMLSYTAQQASGVNCWARDADHIEKAFDFGGMGARNGVAAVTMVQAGFTGVEDVFSGPRNYFFAFAPDDGKPELLLEDLGSRYEITRTNIKKWSVGSPIQAVLDSTQAIITEHDLAPNDIEKVIIRMSDNESHVVDNRHMADINVQHLTSIMVLDRTVSFVTAHDNERMNDADVLAVKKKVALTPDPTLERRKPIIVIQTTAGKEYEHQTHAVRGTPDNPMTREEVDAKAYDLFAGVLGAKKARTLIDTIWNVEKLKTVRDLRPLLMP
ncbi:MAG: MmgE/PrpD family protein [Rhodospirillales bacterium]